MLYLYCILLLNIYSYCALQYTYEWYLVKSGGNSGDEGSCTHALKQLRQPVFTVLFTGSVYLINNITCTLHIHTYSLLLHTVKCTILSLLLLLSTLTDTDQYCHLVGMPLHTRTYILALGYLIVFRASNGNKSAGGDGKIAAGGDEAIAAMATNLWAA